MIDGGNSYYRDDIAGPRRSPQNGIHYLDFGTSGGVYGLERGYCLMIGGDDEPVARLDPLFKSLAPGVGAVERTPGATGEPTTAEQGYLHCGPAGAGHFVKMVHNGIEYGLMAAYAEGMNILYHANIGKQKRDGRRRNGADRDPSATTRTTSTCPTVAEVWRRGSVVASWLLDLTAAALVESPELAEFTGRVSDSGEGRWTVIAAVDEGVPAHGAERRPVQPLRLPRRGRLRRQAAVGDAQAVRRPRREAARRRLSTPGAGSSGNGRLKQFVERGDLTSDAAADLVAEVKDTGVADRVDGTRPALGTAHHPSRREDPEVLRDVLL